MHPLLRDSLGDMDIDYMFNPNTTYSYQGFHNDNKFFSQMDDIILNNKKVLIEGDCDTDGGMAMKVLEDTFKMLNFKNYVLVHYENREHCISLKQVNRAIRERFDYVIILDVGTNDMDKISRLTVHGINVIILDHHVCNYKLDDYPKRALLINSTVENKIRGELFYECCGASVTYMLCDEYLKRCGKDGKLLSPYALIALYADSINMVNPLNVGIYNLVKTIPQTSLPSFISPWLNSGKRFTRRFISFTLVPKINTLFRTEEFVLLNRLLFENSTNVVLQSLGNVITKIHDQTRELVAQICDTCNPKISDNLILVDLMKFKIANIKELAHFTGLVANNFSDYYKRPCVVLASSNNAIKGSFRDVFSREYLKFFKQFCDCDGHQAAFGIHVKPLELNDFMIMTEVAMNAQYAEKDIKEPICITTENLFPDMELINDIAWYNEFSGVGYPVVLLSRKQKFKETKSYYKFNYKYIWGDTFVESKTKLIPGTKVGIRPVYPDRLIVEKVNM